MGNVKISKDARLFSGWVGLFAVMALWMFLALIPGDQSGAVRVMGNGMLPQLLPGDLMLMKTRGSPAARGDVVTFLPTREQAAIGNLGMGLQISRVVGVPGDRLQRTGSGYLLNATDTVESVYANDWLGFGQVLVLPAGKYFLLNSGDPASFRRGERGSASIGLVDIQQMRVMERHVPASDILSSAAPAVIVGALMIVTLAWFLWFCGSYFRPLLPLKVILGLSWTVLFLMAAAVLVLRVTGRADHSPMVFGAYFYYRYFRWLGDSTLAHFIVAAAMFLLMGGATWLAKRRCTFGEEDLTQAVAVSSGTRVWPLGFAVLAISLVVMNRVPGTMSGVWGVIAVLISTAILALLWQVEVAGASPASRKSSLWSARILRFLRLSVGILAGVAMLFMTDDWVRNGGRFYDPVRPDAFFQAFCAMALLAGYGLPGVRPRSILSVLRSGLLQPANRVRVLGLLTILASVGLYAYQQQQSYALQAQVLQAAGAKFSLARVAVEEFFQREARLPDEIDTTAIFGDAAHTRGMNFVGPGVLRVAVEPGSAARFHVFMQFEPDAGKPFGIGYRCIYNDASLHDRNALQLGCRYEPGLDVRSFASRRSLAARTPRAADGPFAETRVYFRLGGTGRDDMGPESLPPPARKNSEAARYMQLLDASLRQVMAVVGGGPREVEVVGYADATGPEDGNQSLSEARAESVKAYLVDLGIPESVISVRGAGQEPMPQECSTGQPHIAECLYRSRRVEVRVWK